MSNGGLLTSAWPRHVAHAIVLLSLAVIWMLPHAQASVVAASANAPKTDATPVPQPVQAMAERPRTVSALPIASVAFEQLPLPAAPAARTSTRATVKGSVVSPIPARYVPARDGYGNDISWPQCGGAYPGEHDVGVVGVTGGRPFTANPCLAGEFGWARASQMSGGAQAYLNLELDGTSNGPHRCAADDHACRAYDYGWVSVADAMGRAAAARVTPSFWWLDVEVGNVWSDEHPDWNQATVQGAIDATHSRGFDAGIYSSTDQWAQILPGSYHPMVPTWLAVVGNSTMAPGLCVPGFSLTGGPVYMVQYDDHGFDSDHVCAAGTTAFAAAGTRHPH